MSIRNWNCPNYSVSAINCKNLISVLIRSLKVTELVLLKYEKINSTIETKTDSVIALIQLMGDNRNNI